MRQAVLKSNVLHLISNRAFVWLLQCFSLRLAAMLCEAVLPQRQHFLKTQQLVIDRCCFCRLLKTRRPTQMTLAPLSKPGAIVFWKYTVTGSGVVFGTFPPGGQTKRKGLLCSERRNLEDQCKKRNAHVSKQKKTLVETWPEKKQDLLISWSLGSSVWKRFSFF